MRKMRVQCSECAKSANLRGVARFTRVLSRCIALKTPSRTRFTRDSPRWRVGGGNRAKGCRPSRRSPRGPRNDTACGRSALVQKQKPKRRRHKKRGSTFWKNIQNRHSVFFTLIFLETRSPSPPGSKHPNTNLRSSLSSLLLFSRLSPQRTHRWRVLDARARSRPVRRSRRRRNRRTAEPNLRFRRRRRDPRARVHDSSPRTEPRRRVLRKR
mmetsp:Transcript_5681/g.18770  ORF Transcript_5681/g.18770 Transcript_5681/m.18770 type:complete len:212 (-) Transcript_5681:642-1277(-)